MEISLNPPHSLKQVRTPLMITQIFEAMVDGVNDFIKQTGGPCSYYGISKSETVIYTFIVMLHLLSNII